MENILDWDSPFDNVSQIKDILPGKYRECLGIRCIMVRLVHKSQLFTRSREKIFKANFVDATGEIRATAFKEYAEKFFDQLEEGKIYFIYGFLVKYVDKNNKHGNMNPCELILNESTEITPINGEDPLLPTTLKYDVVPLDVIKTAKMNTFIGDIIAVVHKVKEIETIRCRDGSDCSKRDLTLVDQSMAKVTLRLWRSQAEEFEVGTTVPVIALRNAKVKVFGTFKYLEPEYGSPLHLNPDIAQVDQVAEWYSNLPENMDFVDMSFI